MNEKALEVLEYKKIIGLLMDKAGCEMSREIVSGLTPFNDVRTISEELRSTTEAVDLIVRKGELPTAGIYDILPAVQLARKGGTMSMKQLLQVHYNLSIAARVVSFLKSDVPEVPMIMLQTCKDAEKGTSAYR